MRAIEEHIGRHTLHRWTAIPFLLQASFPMALILTFISRQTGSIPANPVQHPPVRKLIRKRAGSASGVGLQPSRVQLAHHLFFISNLF